MYIPIITDELIPAFSLDHFEVIVKEKGWDNANKLIRPPLCLTGRCKWQGNA